MGAVCVIAGIGAAFLPETLNENLPQTIEDGEEFGKDQKFFSLAKTKKVRSASIKPTDECYRKVSSEL